jgi:hypothetical protein
VEYLMSRLNESLNLVLPLFRATDDKDPYAYIHSQPIGTSVFDAHFRLLIRTYEMMIGDGVRAFLSALRYLKLSAQGMAEPPEPPETLYMPLLNEIERLSFAVVASKTGWETIPLQQAVSQKLLEPGDEIEAMNSSVFFTAVWHVAPKNKRLGTLEYGMNLWGSHTSPSPLTEWIASLPTSTPAADSNVTAAPATVPAPAGSTVSLTV